VLLSAAAMVPNAAVQFKCFTITLLDLFAKKLQIISDANCNFVQPFWIRKLTLHKSAFQFLAVRPAASPPFAKTKGTVVARDALISILFLTAGQYRAQRALFRVAPDDAP
jgi:hypothetical protein